jgi:RNA polymerase sigma-70 factor, ECF subfamily
MTSAQQLDRDSAFERLFLEYQRPILSYLFRMLGDAGRAEEVAQDVFVRAYRALADLPEEANVRAWLYRIATNAGYDQLRRRRLIQWLPLLDDDHSPSVGGNPEGLVGERQAVQRALMQVPPKYRIPLVLYAVEGYSTVEIGEIMGITQGAVKTRLYRAREHFRQAFGGDL